jgi:uncharacterized protein (TIGR02594 family)
MKDILKMALSQYGITETKGVENNPEVMKYYHETGRTWVSADETPWCDAFLDWCAMKSGLEFSPGLNARGWLDMGEKVDPALVEQLALEIPIVTVLWRGDPVGIYGHVGLFVRKNEDSVWLLGGNQGIGQVNIQPFTLNRVLGYRRLWK